MLSSCGWVEVMLNALSSRCSELNVGGVCKDVYAIYCLSGVSGVRTMLDENNTWVSIVKLLECVGVRIAGGGGCN